MDDITIGPILPLKLQRRLKRIVQIQDILNENQSTVDQTPLTPEKTVSFLRKKNQFFLDIFIWMAFGFIGFDIVGSSDLH